MTIVMLPFLAFVNIIVGVPTVTDGDSLRIGATRIRLEGLDAPEIGQSCQISGENWRCGAAAADALQEFIDAKNVRCEISGKDRYGRSLARCWLDDWEINSWMVKSGWALAYRRYSDAYVAEEDQARISRVGLWQSQFVEPWIWRSSKER